LGGCGPILGKSRKFLTCFTLKCSTNLIASYKARSAITGAHSLLEKPSNYLECIWKTLSMKQISYRFVEEKEELN